MDTNPIVGEYVHRGCKRAAYLVDRAPRKKKQFDVQHIVKDVTGRPVHPAPTYICPCCEDVIHMHSSDLEFRYLEGK